MSLQPPVTSPTDTHVGSHVPLPLDNNVHTFNPELCLEMFIKSAFPSPFTSPRFQNMLAATSGRSLCISVDNRQAPLPFDRSVCTVRTPSDESYSWASAVGRIRTRSVNP